MKNQIERLVSCLNEGYTLTNRGTGWYLAPEYVAYKTQDSELIGDELVTEMEKRGIITVEIPYNSAKAILCN